MPTAADILVDTLRAVRLRACAHRLRHGSGGHGRHGYSITRPDEVEEVLDRAFAAEGPVLVEAVVDAAEPMMPPKMPPDYAENFHRALPGTPGHEQIEATLAEEPLRTMFTAGAK